MTTQIVKVLADSDLKQNGGQFSVEGNVAQPVINVGSSPKRALGGSAKPVYVVTKEQIDNGSYGFRGGPSLEVADMDVVGSQLKVEQSAAMPVYVVSGDALGEVNWWDPNNEGLSVWAAYQPKGSASLFGSYVDLSGNGHDAGVGIAPTWNAIDGWIFNGLTQYLTTTFMPQTDQSQTVIVQFTGATTNDGYIVGCDQAANREFGIVPLYLTGARVGYLNGALASVTPQLVAGNLAVSGAQGYRNGVANGPAIGGWAGVTLQALYIGCKLDAGAPGSFCACNIQALAIYDTALTAPQIATVFGAMASL